MSVPVISFPVPFDNIPAHVKTLVDFIRAKQCDIEVASTMLRMVRMGCQHKGAKRGYNERDGDWMHPCPHCGESR